MKILDTSRRIAIAGLATIVVIVLCGLNGIGIQTVAFHEFFGRVLLCSAYAIVGMFAVLFCVYGGILFARLFVLEIKHFPGRVRHVDADSESDGTNVR
jgi:hypothetical protein